MAEYPTLARELKALQEEVAALRRDRRSRTAEPVAVAPVAPPPSPAGEPTWPAQLGEFVDEITKFVDDAEESVAAHPAASVLGALVVGILLGRLLARR